MTRWMLAAASAALLGAAAPAHASLLWDWSYDAAGITASGTFTTGNTASAGYFQITGITGSRDGVAITGLTPTGTAIPGNDPYAVDNLLAASGPQLTDNGFGFSLANGDYSNPFYNAGTYYEYLSVPPYPEGTGAEVPVTFSAVEVPEPAAASLLVLALLGLGFVVSRRGLLRSPV